MNHLVASNQRAGSRTVWLSSLLLLAQLLSISPVLFVVLAVDQQRHAWASYTKVLDDVGRFASDLTEKEQRTPGQPVPAQLRAELQRILSGSAAASIRATLTDAEAMLARNDVSAALAELSAAERALRTELSRNSDRIAQTTMYLEAPIAGVCLLAFGVVLVIRRFRREALIQRKLQQELSVTNEEVVAALAVARAEAASKNKLLEHLGSFAGTSSNGAEDATGEPRNWESLARIMSQVADYSKLESGSLKLESMEFEPAGIVSEALELSARLAGPQEVHVSADLGSGLSGVVKGDSRRLRDVLVNVIGAAAGIAGKKGVELSGGETAADGRTTLRFELRLNGTTIPEEVRRQILEPFAELPAPNAHAGLELAISKKLVELMGGRLDVSNSPGGGCIFWFTAVFESVVASPELGGQTQPGDVPSGVQPMRGKGARERRAEQRHGINYPTILRSEEAGIASVRILDVSTSGLRVAAPFRLEVLSEVEIRIEGLSLTGIVRNCTSIRANEFHAGIEIHASSGDEHYLHHLRLLREE